jgi:hypothetical protein
MEKPLSLRGSSIARIAALCAALSSLPRSAAAQALETSDSQTTRAAKRTPHAPPPAIVLRKPPPPELAPPEYARRPLELASEVMLGFPSCSDSAATRCDGLGAGAGLGFSALWRVSPYFAFGGTVSALSFRFAPSAHSQLEQARESGLFYGLLGRLYFADHGAVEPYLELGLGDGSGRSNAREADAVTYAESAGGAALRVGGAVEFYLGRHARFGPALDWTRWRTDRVVRCGEGGACAELDASKSGHALGFTTLSARLTIAIGPGL